MYMLSIEQYSRSHTVGLFTKKDQALSWIKKLEDMDIKEVYSEDHLSIFSMTYDDLPCYKEVLWKDSRYPLTKFMFVPDEGEIQLVIRKIPIMDQVQGLQNTMTRVDAYAISNEDLEDYIKRRERIRKEITSYYKKQGRLVESAGLGSQDGEYLLLDGNFLTHLDPGLVDQWLEVDEGKITISQLLEF